MEEKIVFMDPETGEEILFSVIEQTCIGGFTYLLVTENGEDEEADAYILKEVQTDEDDVIYELLEDDVELDAIAKVFMEILDDIDLV